MNNVEWICVRLEWIP